MFAVTGVLLLECSLIPFRANSLSPDCSCLEERALLKYIYNIQLDKVMEASWRH